MRHSIYHVTAPLLAVVAAGCGAAAEDCDLTLTCASYAKNATETTHDAGGRPDGGGVIPGCEKKPSELDGPPEAKCGIFAAPGAASGGDGSLAAPFPRLQAAVDAAALTGKAVYACADAFEESLRIPSGVTIYGGLDCAAKWAWTPERRTVVKARAAASPGGSEIAVRLSAGDGTTVIEDVDVTAPSAEEAGVSSIAVLIEDTQAEITRCTLTAGDGKGGDAGSAFVDDASFDGLDGEVGYTTCGATNENPGPAGPMKVCGVHASHGGAGGDGGPPPSGNGGDGMPGLPQDPTAPAAGLGGVGQSVNACLPGTIGADGARGNPGDGGSGKGTLSVDGFTGMRGLSGQRGLPGQGGGGGGGSKGKAQVACPGQATLARAGATGGSGGTGGCGGQGGQGGMAGGSSIALASLAMHPVTLTNVAMNVGKGGKGGMGGAGQNGGNGGFGKSGGQGANGTSNGCPGGDGGHGGVGGPGGGGLGGHAIAVGYVGTPPKGSMTVSYAGGTASPGLGGPPGPGSALAVGAGANGLSGEQVSFGP